MMSSSLICCSYALAASNISCTKDISISLSYSPFDILIFEIQPKNMHYDYTIYIIKIQVCQTDTKNIERRQSQPLGPFRQISEKPSSAGKARVVAD